MLVLSSSRGVRPRFGRKTGMPLGRAATGTAAHHRSERAGVERGTGAGEGGGDGGAEAQRIQR